MTDLESILSVLVKEKGVIKEIIYRNNLDSSVRFYDRDSEGEGVLLPELALLWLCVEVFDAEINLNDDASTLLLEMNWLISIVDDISNSGIYLCRLDSTHDHLWSILGRNALAVLHVLDMEPSDISFDFFGLLEKYGFTVVLGEGST